MLIDGLYYFSVLCVLIDRLYQSVLSMLINGMYLPVLCMLIGRLYFCVLCMLMDGLYLSDLCMLIDGLYDLSISGPEDEAIVSELQRIMAKVDEMKAQRSSLHEQFRGEVHKDDITNAIVTHEGTDTQVRDRNFSVKLSSGYTNCYFLKHIYNKKRGKSRRGRITVSVKKIFYLDARTKHLDCWTYTKFFV